MKISIAPSKAYGSVLAPPSKSMAHRGLICAALSSGACVINSIDPSEDILATASCIRALGKNVSLIDGRAFLGDGELRGGDGIALYCRESGSTLRFFLPLALALGGHYFLYGSKTLLERPMSVYEEVCRGEGIVYIKHEDCIEVNGKLSAGTYDIRADVSSQFVSGLLFALSASERRSKLELVGPIASRPYIEMTMTALNAFGKEVSFEDENTIVIPDGPLKAREFTVEGDYSNSAFLDAFNYLGGKVFVDNLNPDSVQGDKIYAQYFEELSNQEAQIDIDATPDLGPVLFALAAALHGGTFTGTKRLKIKESDRCVCMKEELAKFGIECINDENKFTVLPGTLNTPSEILNSHNDHRIVMALAVLLSLTGGVIEGAEAVNKSFPAFFDVLRKLHIEVKEIGMDL